MALTASGRRLTEEHRRAQIALAAEAELVQREMWSELDPFRIQETRDTWLAGSLLAAAVYHDASAELAADYVTSYRAVEADGPTGPIRRPTMDRARVATSLELTGPAVLYMRINADIVDPRVVHRSAANGVAGSVRRHVQSGGRQLIDLSARSDRSALGYRRVADGDPCAFCAMLATRGPVYGTGATAGDPAFGGDKYHDWCGCQAEIVYGAWEPNKAEQGWISDYESVAEEATAVEGVRRAPYRRDGVKHDEDTILRRLRRLGYR